MKMFGIELKDIEKTLSNLGDLKKIRDYILSLKYSDLDDSFYTGDCAVYNQAIDDCINVIDDFIKGGDSYV